MQVLCVLKVLNVLPGGAGGRRDFHSNDVSEQAVKATTNAIQDVVIRVFVSRSSVPVWFVTNIRIVCTVVVLHSSDATERAVLRTMIVTVASTVIVDQVDAKDLHLQYARQRSVLAPSVMSILIVFLDRALGRFTAGHKMMVLLRGDHTRRKARQRKAEKGKLRKRERLLAGESSLVTTTRRPRERMIQKQ